MSQQLYTGRREESGNNLAGPTVRSKLYKTGRDKPETRNNHEQVIETKQEAIVGFFHVGDVTLASPGRDVEIGS